MAESGAVAVVEKYFDRIVFFFVQIFPSFARLRPSSFRRSGIGLETEKKWIKKKGTTTTGTTFFVPPPYFPCKF